MNIGKQNSGTLIIASVSKQNKQGIRIKYSFVIGRLKKSIQTYQINHIF